MRNEEDDLFFEKPVQESPVDQEVDFALLDNNIILLHGELDEDLCGKICKRLMYLQLTDTKEIKIILNSVGGEVYHGLLVFNTMESLKKGGIKLQVEARGICASMGITILMGASERFASKYTRFLLHEVSSWCYGKATEVMEASEELSKVNEMLDEIIIDRTKISKTQLRNLTKKKDWWLSAEEALKVQLIEKVI